MNLSKLGHRLVNERSSALESPLDENTITFGKYKDLSLSHLLRDRKYCMWLLKQDWFAKQYEYLYNKVNQHNPKYLFVIQPHYDLNQSVSIEEFLNQYEYFYLCPLDELKIDLSDIEKTCYQFYLDNIASLKEKIIKNLDQLSPNPFDIKAPTSWLKRFEEQTQLSRDIFKEFLCAYDLPNIPYIVEDIKKMGGIDYKGAKSFRIAKQKSLLQEHFWEDRLKQYFGEDIGTQYKYNNCFFDFINIKMNVLYECKLSLKDFNEDQHNKYLSTLGTFSMVYFIDTDCIVDLKDQVIYTTDACKYAHYFDHLRRNPSKFDVLLQTFPIVEIRTVDDYFRQT